MRKLLLVAAACCVLSSCATTEKYKASLNSWVGHSASELVNSWGYPDSQITGPSGNTVYVYSRSGSVVLPTTTTTNAYVTGTPHSAFGTATSTTYGGGVISMNCQTYFDMSADMRIVGWHFQGNNCKSR